MPTITTRDGTEIYYKDWGAGRPVVFSHGWPLNADAWDHQAVVVTGAGTAGPPRRGTATTWTSTPTTSRS